LSALYKKEGEGNEFIENFITRPVRGLSIYGFPSGTAGVTFAVLLVVMLCSSASDRLLLMMKICSVIQSMQKTDAECYADLAAPKSGQAQWQLATYRWS
jgi:hypothetical protein